MIYKQHMTRLVSIYKIGGLPKFAFIHSKTSSHTTSRLQTLILILEIDMSLSILTDNEVTQKNRVDMHHVSLSHEVDDTVLSISTDPVTQQQNSLTKNCIKKKRREALEIFQICHHHCLRESA